MKILDFVDTVPSPCCEVSCRQRTNPATTMMGLASVLWVTSALAPAQLVLRGCTRLVATWHVGCDGRPVCQWTLDEPSVPSRAG